jgi:hypothetical protein
MDAYSKFTLIRLLNKTKGATPAQKIDIIDKVNLVLEYENTTWDYLLSPHTQPLEPKKRDKDIELRSQKIDHLFEQVRSRVRVDFIESLYMQWLTSQTMSQKQLQALKNFYQNTW